LTSTPSVPAFMRRDSSGLTRSPPPTAQPVGWASRNLGPAHRGVMNVVQPHFHNNVLQIAAERGLPCVALWLWLVAAAMGDSYREARRGSTAARGAAIGALGVLCAVMVARVWVVTQFLSHHRPPHALDDGGGVDVVSRVSSQGLLSRRRRSKRGHLTDR